MNGGATVANNLQVNGTAHMSELDLNGNGDVSGDLLVHGALLSEQHLTAGNTEISANDETAAALYVKQSSTHAIQPALDVFCENSSLPAIRATGDTALDAYGTVRLNLNTIILGGSGETEVAIRSNPDGKVIEFLVGGNVTFYIDDTGGHNA